MDRGADYLWVTPKEEAFAFGDSNVDSGEAKWERAGTVRRRWVAGGHDEVLCSRS